MLIAQNVTKSYPTARGPIPVLQDVSLQLERGQAASIMGPSGSGKSTLLHILGALDPPTSGMLTLDGEDPFSLGEKQLASFRNRKIGFVFQDHCLLPQCSVLENVLIPTIVADKKDDYPAHARELLKRVGLSDRLEHLPSELSGGEKQRVAIARALICGPGLLLCDEPTGSLDAKSAAAVTELLLELRNQQNVILVIVTHNEALASQVPIRYVLEDQRLAQRN